MTGVPLRPLTVTELEDLRTNPCPRCEREALFPKDHVPIGRRWRPGLVQSPAWDDYIGGGGKVGGMARPTTDDYTTCHKCDGTGRVPPSMKTQRLIATIDRMMQGAPSDQWLAALRPWDPTHGYAGAVVKVYSHWMLELSWRQHTPGAFIFFCRREGVRLESELADVELLELRQARREMEVALRAHFKPDHFNYLQLGNSLPSLHLHGIPRYADRRPELEQLLGRDHTDGDIRRPPVWRDTEVDAATMHRLVQRVRGFFAA